MIICTQKYVFSSPDEHRRLIESQSDLQEAEVFPVLSFSNNFQVTGNYEAQVKCAEVECPHHFLGPSLPHEHKLWVGFNMNSLGDV